MNLPKTISPCPILDAIFEMRFSSRINHNAVFGLIYNALQNDFGKVENLPILQLPEIVRTNDPNLAFKPHYRISNNEFVIQIGPDVLTISSFPNYVGWSLFSEKIFEILQKVERIGIIDKIERIGIRYVNFFDFNIFEKINLKICIDSKDIPYNNTVFRTEIEHGSFNSTLQIANNAINNSRTGSIIDIDTFSHTNLEKFFIDKEDIINNGHTYEKNLFFSLLEVEFLTTLNPTY